MHSLPARHLFVYGTLRRGCANAEATWLAEVALWIGTAQVAGRLYHVAGYPGLVPDARGLMVRGDLFRLPHGPAGETILARLDAYEECAADCPAPHEYARIILPVQTQDGTVDAWTYVYRHSTAGLDLVVGGDFLRDALPPPR
ncbi:gamma-glutamylcyclotransferase family protein [Sphingobium algorifonticola]|uniref:Gamma-glutamylcyclotransferase n=1 Tax=Sphingobium algorifonticola TaxID=2008318 RepID=A0A437JC44_9SPHN|nr:gamma-glutamylcyclotransferase family protein [Sphingobium algorifonticola]RVT43479.1 gamma-glutamylcyclotransferase [Sphingobium algorifonticola]